MVNVCPAKFKELLKLYKVLKLLHEYLIILTSLKLHTVNLLKVKKGYIEKVQELIKV